MNAPHEEAMEFAKQSKRENRVYVGNLSYDVKYRDLMEFMRGGGLEDLSSVFRLLCVRGELVHGHGHGKLVVDLVVPDMGDVAAGRVRSRTKSEVTASDSDAVEVEAPVREVRLRRDVWFGHGHGDRIDWRPERIRGGPSHQQRSPRRLPRSFRFLAG